MVQDLGLRIKKLEAIKALGQMGPAALAGVPIIMEYRRAFEYEWFPAVMSAVTKIDPAAALVMADEELRDAISRLQSYPRNCVGEHDWFGGAVTIFRNCQFGPAGAAAIPVLTNRLDDASLTIRVQAACLLAELGAGERVLPLLIETVERGVRNYDSKDGSYDLGVIAIEAVGWVGTAGAAAVPALVAALPKYHYRVRAAESLWRVGDVGQAVRALTEAAAADDFDWSGKAVDLLGAIGELAAVAVHVLIRLLEAGRGRTVSSSSIATPARVVRALGDIGPAAAAAVPVILNLSTRFCPSTAAATALMRIDPATYAERL